MRDQAKAAEQRFPIWNGVVTDVGLEVAANEGAQVTRPDIAARQLTGQVNVEVGFQPGCVRDGFVVGAHVAESML